METGNESKVGVIAYEFLGTAFIMYAIMVETARVNGTDPLAGIGVNFLMMALAWNISGGHFNPAISVAVFVSEKQGKNTVTLILELVAQFAGAFLGVLLGFSALVDKTYQENNTPKGYSTESNVPRTWVGTLAPIAPSSGFGYDYGPATDA